jgi:polyisoprenyl-phosphate glycosyltransferase
VRESREDPFVGLMFSYLYNRLMGRIAIKNWPQRGFDFVLFSRRVLEVVLASVERNTSIFAYLLWSGFSQTSLTYKRTARLAGRSKWTLGKKVKLAIDSVISFSFLPIRLMSVVGLVCATMGALYAGFVIFENLTHGVTITGWSSLMVVLLIVSGLQMVMLGVIGEYLWRVLDQARARPPFVIAERVGFTTPLHAPPPRDGAAVQGMS